MNIEEVVIKLESYQLIRSNRLMNEWYSIYCPFHSNGEERKPSCGILLHDTYKNGQLYPQGLCHCFTCGYAEPLPKMISDLLQKHNISKSGIDWLKENIDGFDDSENAFEYLVPQDTMSALTSKYAVNYIQSLLSNNPKYVTEEELQSYRYTVPYMYERKLTDKVIEDYDIGVDLNWVPPGRKRPVPSITFPVRDKFGHTLFICRRSIEGKFFNIPEGVDKPVYGIDMVPKDCKSLIICESCINALTAVVYGYSAVALLGTSNPYQIKQLRELGVNEFVLCMDGDEAGHKATKKLKKALSDVAIVWTVEIPDGEDLNSLESKEVFDTLYANKV